MLSTGRKWLHSGHISTKSLKNPHFNPSNSPKSLALTKQLHAYFILLHGFHFPFHFGPTSIAFHRIPFKNSRSWNSIISGYSNNKKFLDVLHLYKWLRSENFQVDSFNLVFFIKSCLGPCLLQTGKCAHSEAIKWGLETDSYVTPALMNLYIELGWDLEEARKVFEEMPERNSVIWGVMMKGYLRFSQEPEIFELFRLGRRSGFELDPFCVESLIRACGSTGAEEVGKALHGCCVKLNFLESNYCLRTSLVDMYMKCGLLNLAIKYFEEIAEKDVVLWSTMIDGFTKNGKAFEAISFFQKMLKDSTMPNAITLASGLQACSQLGALQHGKSVHSFAIRNGIKLDVVSYTTLIDMYARCGVIEAAHRVFSLMPKRNVFAWSVMINGFGIHGLYAEAFVLFETMRSENLIPNAITFVSILSACSHSGRVKEGWAYFELMSKEYGITPLEEHYACMVDLLGRAGQVEEAKEFIEKMPAEPGSSVWGALLSACRVYRRFELVEEVAMKLLILEPDQSSVYVLLSNIYATAGIWEMVKETRQRIVEKGIQKTIGFSSIEIKNKMFVFSATDVLAYTSMKADGLSNVLCEVMGALACMLGKNNSNIE